MTLLAVTSLHFAWPGAGEPLLDIPALEVLPGEHVLLRGPSGSGKSTLLAAIAGAVDVGRAMLTGCGTDIGAFRGTARDRFRADHLGIIYQLFNLIPYRDALDNVTRLAGFPRSGARRRAIRPARPEVYLRRWGSRAMRCSTHPPPSSGSASSSALSRPER